MQWKCKKIFLVFKIIVYEVSCFGKISQFRWQYMWTFVNLLKHSPKISDLTKRDVSGLDLSDINGKLG